jgi:ribulose-5-phosphate 4-epimerase/fuculose-1-phosphate aldolase
MNADGKQTVLKEVSDISLYLYKTGLIAGTSGNVSARIPKTDFIAVTPSGISYELYTADIMCVVDANGNQLEGPYKPSSETPMHTAIMKAMPGVNAIIHTHSPYAMTFAVLGEPIAVVSVEGLKFGAPLIYPTDGFITPGSADMGPAILTAAGKPGAANNAVLLRNHGLVVMGETTAQALELAQAAELTARVYYQARAVGNPIGLSQEQITRAAGRYIMYNYHSGRNSDMK